jgi:hypothetical protein
MIKRLFECFPDLALEYLRLEFSKEKIVPPEDSIEDARACFNKVNLENKKALVVYGLGQGYYYEASKTWLKEDSRHRLVFLEDEIKNFKFFFDSPRGAIILDDPQISFYYLHDEKAILAYLSALFFNSGFEVCATKDYINNRTENYERVRSLLFAESAVKQSMYLELVREKGRDFWQNFYTNIWLLDGSLQGSGLFGKFRDVPAIICGGGPSMHKMLPLLPQLEDKALIFSSGTALLNMSKENITPHFTFGVDPFLGEFRRQYYNTFFEAPFGYNTRVSAQGLSMIHGQRLYMSGNVGYPITQWIEEKLGIAVQDNIGGIFSSTFCLDMACSLGCNPIIMFGMDMSSQKPIPKEKYNPENILRASCQQKNYKGENVCSNWELVFGNYWISEYIQNNKDRQFINIVDAGMAIDGAENITMDKLNLSRQYDTKGLVQAVLSQMPQIKAPAEQIKVYLKDLKESLERCKDKIDTKEEGYRLALLFIDHLYSEGLLQEYANAALLPFPEQEQEKEKIKKKKEQFLQEAIEAHLGFLTDV